MSITVLMKKRKESGKCPGSCLRAERRKSRKGQSVKVGFQQCVALSLPFAGLFIWNESCHNAS